MEYRRLFSPGGAYFFTLVTYNRRPILSTAEAIEKLRAAFRYAPIPDALPALGYMVRALGDASELPARSWISWKAFHPNQPDERYEGWQWYAKVQRRRSTGATWPWWPWSRTAGWQPSPPSGSTT